MFERVFRSLQLPQIWPVPMAAVERREWRVESVFSQQCFQKSFFTKESGVSSPCKNLFTRVIAFMMAKWANVKSVILALNNWFSFGVLGLQPSRTLRFTTTTESHCFESLAAAPPFDAPVVANHFVDFSGSWVNRPSRLEGQMYLPRSAG